MKAVGRWTNAVYDCFSKLESRRDVAVHIRGPHGAAAMNYFEYKHIILIGSGVGVTPLLAIWKYLKSISIKARMSSTSTTLEGEKNENSNRSYDSIDKIHYFPFNERNVLCVVQHFKNSNFDIQPELLTYFDKVEKMNNNKDEHIPGIYSFKLKNLTDKAINFMISSIGVPSKDNLAIYNDRRNQLGLHHFEQEELEQSLNALTVLSKNIVTREAHNVLIPPSVYPIERVLESLLELNRLPLLVILPHDTPLDGLIAVHKGLTNILFNEDMSVLFRTDNHSNREFNEFVNRASLRQQLSIASTGPRFLSVLVDSCPNTI